MDRRTVTDEFSVSSQLDVGDIEVLARQGVRTLINNRPDGEHPLQPASAELARAAARLGLAYIDLPIGPGALTDAVVDRYASLRAGIRTPAVAFCRSGTRSISLWALAEARTRGVEEVLRMAWQAGYDLGALRPRLAARARTGGETGPGA